MNRKSHLTEFERYQIHALLRVMTPHQAIADILRRHRSTIDREVRRNKGQRGYRPIQAQQFASARLRSRALANVHRIDPALWGHVRERLAAWLSPEQIVGELPSGISHTSIYRFIRCDRDAGGTLYRNLRCRKMRRQRHRSAKRCLIPNRVPIEQRPAIVERRGRIGDWEGDTIVDRTFSHAVVSLVERDSMFVVLAKVERKGAQEVSSAIIDHLRASGLPAHTLTLDNGSEFTAHERITHALGTQCYFAKPYAAWQRGRNENTNGLIRQYIPKSTPMRTITQDDLDRIAHALNTRPRKTRGFLSPKQYLMRYLTSTTRALRS